MPSGNLKGYFYPNNVAGFSEQFFDRSTRLQSRAVDWEDLFCWSHSVTLFLKVIGCCQCFFPAVSECFPRWRSRSRDINGFWTWKLLPWWTSMLDPLAEHPRAKKSKEKPDLSSETYVSCDKELLYNRNNPRKNFFCEWSTYSNSREKVCEWWNTKLSNCTPISPCATPIFPKKAIVIVEALKSTTHQCNSYGRHTHLQLLDRVILSKHSNTEVLNIQLEHECA